jgi:hypothetical protein
MFMSGDVSCVAWCKRQGHVQVLASAALASSIIVFLFIFDVFHHFRLDIASHRLYL